MITTPNETYSRIQCRNSQSQFSQDENANHEKQSCCLLTIPKNVSFTTKGAWKFIQGEPNKDLA